MERFAMPDELVHEMCAQLGVGLPGELGEVSAFYRAWCQRVPFDSISKAVARREGTLPPGGDPVAFCQQWLATGLGGTCWGHTAAMAAVLESAGIRCRVGLDRFLGEDIVDFHSFLVVEDGDRRFACDVTHTSGDPLPLEPGARGNHPAYPVAVEDDDGRLMHTFVRMSRNTRQVGRYVVLSIDLDAADLRSFCEVTRTYGMRANNLYHRRFNATEMIDCGPADDGSALVLREVSADGESTRSITDPDEAFSAMGYGPEALKVALRAGLVEIRPGGDVFYAPRRS